MMKNDTPTKVLYLGHTAGLGGAEIALFNLVNNIDQQRYHPVVALGASGPLYDKFRAAGLEIHLCAMPHTVVQTRKDSLSSRTLLQPGIVFPTLAYVLRLRRFILEQQIQIVHTNTLKSHVMGGLAAHLAGVPTVWHMRDRIADDYLPSLVVRVFQWLCRVLPDFIIANSAATLATLQLPNGDQSIVAYSGIPVPSRVVHDGTALVQETPSVKMPERIAIGMIGRISPWKGQHIFIEAAATVRHEFPHVRFQIVGAPLFGEEAYEARLRAQVTALKLDDCVELTGFRSDVPALLPQLDILVHASTIGEPFGQVIVEGMAAGKPLVATNGGGVPEIVEDGVTGLLVPMGDAPAMATAIIRLLRDPARAKDMGVAGRHRVRDHFTIETTARRVEAVYETVQRRHPLLFWIALWLGTTIALLIPCAVLLRLLKFWSRTPPASD